MIDEAIPEDVIPRNSSIEEQQLENIAAATEVSAPREPGSSAGGGRTVALLQQIQSGQTHTKTIALDDRRLLVAYLMSDGYSTAEIAQLLKVSDRSIERDKQAIRQSNALPKDPKLTEQLAGRLMVEAELVIQRIRRTSREKLTPPNVKVDGEHRCFQIISDLVQRLQGLGYLPTASQRLEADVVHHAGEIPDIDMLGAELKRLRSLTANFDGEVPNAISELEAQFERASLAVKVNRIATHASVVQSEDVNNDNAA